ncbi:MAG: pantoate--beta-alanine ligase [Bacteroidales bacterium]|nr:pantoate--beta-alanine ligase [Bacteroidales bacterium]
MEVLHAKERMQEKILRYNEKNMTIGFVPTMGALHEGHLSLVECSRRRDDVTVVSIFVNPAQFNQRDDYEKYPRDLKSDLNHLEQAGVDVVFTPTEQEMYPEPDNREFDFGGLDKVMEGKHRPGHFDGVARIVTRLFDLVMPHRAYFGEKDYQQLAIIRHLTRQMRYNIDIVGCPIIRESDGLAKSSRNARLTHEQRKEAPEISQALFEAIEHSGRCSPDEIREQVISRLNKNPQIDVEYFEIVDDKTLKPIRRKEEAKENRACIAAWVGSVRLIDNVKISF